MHLIWKQGPLFKTIFWVALLGAFAFWAIEIIAIPLLDPNPALMPVPAQGLIYPHQQHGTVYISYFAHTLDSVARDLGFTCIPLLWVACSTRNFVVMISAA